VTVDRRLAIAALGTVAIIIYGSLSPFHFRNVAFVNGPLRALLGTWQIPGSRGDYISNFLLYIPLGLFSVRALRGLPRWLTLPLVTIAGAALSMCIEMVQYYDPGRSSEMSDVYANVAGTIAGAIAAAFIRRDLAPGTRINAIGAGIVWRPFAMLLLGCWLGNRLFPYVLQFGFPAHVVWNSPPLLELYKYVTWWLAIAVLLESILEIAGGAFVLGASMAIVLLARMFLIAQPIPPAEIYGALLALLLWGALPRLHRPAIVTTLFVSLVILQALDRFHFAVTAKSFGWIPFASFIEGPRENGVRVFFEKAFTYGALVWLPMRAGVSFPVATICATVLVFALRLAQVFLPGRSAEITDAAMVLMMAGLMWLLRETTFPTASKTRK
jgi:VanZ family protein